MSRKIFWTDFCASDFDSVDADKAIAIARIENHSMANGGWLDEGQLDAERLLIPLTNARGKISAWCLALPFLRPAEVTGPQLGDDYLQGITQVHQAQAIIGQGREHLLLPLDQPGQRLRGRLRAHQPSAPGKDRHARPDKDEG